MLDKKIKYQDGFPKAKMNTPQTQNSGNNQKKFLNKLSKTLTNEFKKLVTNQY